MEIAFVDAAISDLQFWKDGNDKKVIQRITQLIQSIQQTPFQGIGKPEPLKHNLTGYWSRRINKEHRIVYRVEDNRIIIISLRFHYQR
jgi:toxin YoeB